jgi:predicted transcriptional regulator
MQSLIKQRKSERFMLLYALYRKSAASSDYATNLRDLANNDGMSYKSFKAAFDYLAKEGLVKMRTNSDDPEFFYHGCITDEGINAIEEAFRDESMETAYFPSFREMMM